MHCGECISSIYYLRVQFYFVWYYPGTVHNASKIRIMSLIGVMMGWRIQGYGLPVCVLVSQTPPPHSVNAKIQLAQLRSTPCPCTTNLMWPMKSTPSTVIIFSHTRIGKLNNLGIRILIWNKWAINSLSNSLITVPLEDMKKGNKKKQVVVIDNIYEYIHPLIYYFISLWKVKWKFLILT